MNDDQARSRFFVLQVVRLGGAVLMVLGMLGLSGKLDLPKAAAVALLVIGIVDFLVIPFALAKRWKSPPQ